MELKYLGENILNEVCKPVEEIDSKTLEQLDQMVEIMNQHNGIGLAAPQVGLDKRMFILKEEDSVRFIINPKIISFEGEMESPEGCLSLPGYLVFIKRPFKIVVEYQNEWGDTVTEEREDWQEVAPFLHENDHLNGILTINHPDKIKVLKKKK